MNIDPDILAVILGLITNGLTSLLSAAENKIGKLIIGKEFDEKWKLEKTALLPILQTTISQLEEHIDLKGVKGEEIICLFLLSSEVEDVVRQIYSLQFIENDDQHENLNSLYKVFQILFIRFVASYRVEIAPEEEWVENNSKFLLDSLIKSCNFALNLAIDKGVLAAHEAQSNFRHNIMISEIKAIQKKLNFLVSQQQLDINAIFEFEKKYRQQIIERHGNITPPDFDTARQIPIDELYVYPSFEPISQLEMHNTLQLSTFLAQIYRAVLLGNPGGGKSTFTTKLCHDLVNDYSLSSYIGRHKLIPILVSLRSYGVEKKDRRCSILEFIETEAEGTYQLTTPPDGTFEYLLLNGRAFVIFDGLDELLDTSFRQEIRDDVQSFCNLYPSVPVLVTSREIGYEQAPLNNRLFEVYRLAPFDDNQVSEYVKKWFTIADTNIAPKARQQRIEHFLEESQNVSDLRSIPLMLALMCNIYKGENYIPKNRPEVYEKCATMLFERWDRSRNIRFTLPFEAHIRPAMMYIAHWIYTNVELRAGVTEKMLIAKASEYLLRRRFEDPDEAEAAAQEFIAFCRGRAWVFTDTGTEKAGERLYQFTHQTFLEYFTAAYIVRKYPTPETILAILIPRIVSREWDVVAQLAFQIQNKSSEDAGDNLLVNLLEQADVAENEATFNILDFASRCLNFIIPTPKVARKITSKSIKFVFSQARKSIESSVKDSRAYMRLSIITSLFSATIENCSVISDELEKIFVESIMNGYTTQNWIALDLCFSLNPEIYSKEYPWSNIFERILTICSDKSEKIYPKSLFLYYKAVWDGYTNINNMITWFGLGCLFDVTNSYNLFRNSAFGGSMAEVLIEEALNHSNSDEIWYQKYIHLLEDLGQGFSFDSAPKLKKSYSLDKDKIQNLIKHFYRIRNRNLDRLEIDVIFALFILFATLVELCDRFDPDFSHKSHVKRNHPINNLFNRILLTRFQQDKQDILEKEIIEYHFSLEKQGFIWKWIRREVSLLNHQEIKITDHPSEPSGIFD